MRFSKGSIELSSIQDMQLLRQVVHSKFITHDQLFEFMTLGCYENKKPSFNWRVRRLVETVSSNAITCRRSQRSMSIESVPGLPALASLRRCFR